MAAFSRRLLFRVCCRRLSSFPNPNPNPNPSEKKSLGSTVRSLLKEYDLEKLVSLFKKHSESPIFRSKRGVYDVIVRRLSAGGRQDLVAALLDDQQRHVASEGFAARLISLYGHARMPDHAAAVFRRLPELNCPRSALSFNALLTAFSLSSDADRMAETLREMPSQDSRIVPNTISYNILVSTLCDKGQYDAALDSLNLMQVNNVVPNLITFNTILNGLYQNGRFHDAEKVWGRLVEQNIDPDIWSYNAKLRGLVAEKRLNEATELVEHLKGVGLKPDIYTYNALIKGYYENGNLEEANKIYKGLGKNGCASNRRTFEMLVSEFCKVGDLEMALKLCKESISQRCCVGVGVLQEVVDGLARSSRFEEAKRLVERAKLKSYVRKSLRMPLPCLAV